MSQNTVLECNLRDLKSAAIRVQGQAQLGSYTLWLILLLVGPGYLRPELDSKAIWTQK